MVQKVLWTFEEAHQHGSDLKVLIWNIGSRDLDVEKTVRKLSHHAPDRIVSLALS